MAVPLLMLDMTDGEGRPLFQLLDDYEYELGPGCFITVPDGYITNFGSIPRLFYRIVTPTELREAAIVHDFLCNESFSENVRLESGYSRWIADAVLYEAMARLGFRWPTRFSVYVAVRAWSWLSGQNRWPQKPERLVAQNGVANDPVV